MMKLPADQRAALTLIGKRGFSYKEVARILRFPEGDRGLCGLEGRRSVANAWGDLSGAMNRVWDGGNDMNCETSSQLISRLLDHELSDAEQAALREHLAQCPACAKLERDSAAFDAAAGVCRRRIFRRTIPGGCARRSGESQNAERRPSLSPFGSWRSPPSMLSTAVMFSPAAARRQAEVRQPGVANETAPRGKGSFMPLPAIRPEERAGRERIGGAGPGVRFRPGLSGRRHALDGH